MTILTKLEQKKLNFEVGIKSKKNHLGSELRLTIFCPRFLKTSFSTKIKSEWQFFRIVLSTKKSGNISNNPLAVKMVNSNVAEIYLDGVRIAYIPVDQDKKLYESIKDFYTPSAKTVYHLALKENEFSVEAFDLKSVMDYYTTQDQKLDIGDRLFIFEDKFFNELIVDQSKNTTYDISEVDNLNAINLDSVI